MFRSARCPLRRVRRRAAPRPLPPRCRTWLRYGLALATSPAAVRFVLGCLMCSRSALLASGAALRVPGVPQPIASNTQFVHASCTRGDVGADNAPGLMDPPHSFLYLSNGVSHSAQICVALCKHNVPPAGPGFCTSFRTSNACVSKPATNAFELADAALAALRDNLASCSAATGLAAAETLHATLTHFPAACSRMHALGIDEFVEHASSRHMKSDPGTELSNALERLLLRLEPGRSAKSADSLHNMMYA